MLYNLERQQQTSLLHVRRLSYIHGTWHVSYLRVHMWYYIQFFKCGQMILTWYQVPYAQFCKALVPQGGKRNYNFGWPASAACGCLTYCYTAVHVVGLRGPTTYWCITMLLVRPTVVAPAFLHGLARWYSLKWPWIIYLRRPQTIPRFWHADGIISTDTWGRYSYFYYAVDGFNRSHILILRRSCCMMW